MWNEKPSFRFEIDNFSEKEAPITSKTFMSGGCEWYLYVYPKGDRIFDEHVYLYLCVANHKSLGTGWKREAGYYFVLLNQSNKKLHSSSRQARSVFWDWIPGWGFRTAMPLSSFQDKGFLENDRLIIEVYVKNVEAIDGEGRYLSEKKKETVEFNGFQVLVSQVAIVRKIFAEHPDIAKDFKQKNQVLKSAYMNVLLNLIEVLYKPSQNHSETELADAQTELCELMKVGFKLDWLKSKFEEVSLLRKIAADGYGLWIQQLEARVKNLELVESKVEEVSLDRQKAQEADVSQTQQLELMESKLEEVCLERKNADDAYGDRFQNLEESVKNLKLTMESKVEEVSLQRKKAYDAVGSQVQELEERVKNLEWMELDFKLDSLKSKLEEVSLESKKTDTANGSQVQKLKERIKKFELMDLGSLKSKLEEVYLERKKADADGYRVQKLEESFKNLEMMVSNLKVELDKEKENSSVDGFFFVDEVA